MLAQIAGIFNIGYLLSILSIVALMLHNRRTIKKIISSIQEEPSSYFLSKNDIFMGLGLGAIGIIGALIPMFSGTSTLVISFVLIFALLFLSKPFYMRLKEMKCSKCGVEYKYVDKYAGKISFVDGKMDIVDEELREVFERGNVPPEIQQKGVSMLMGFIGFNSLPENVRKLLNVYIIKRTFKCPSCSNEVEKYLFLQANFFGSRNRRRSAKREGITIPAPSLNLKFKVPELANSELGKKLAEEPSLKVIKEVVSNPNYFELFKLTERDKAWVIRS